jgi:hypothetical protein
MNIQIGTEIYYTGDMANASGHFKVVSLARTNSSNMCTLREINGDREFRCVYFSQIGNTYHGHCNPRFVTEAARQEYRAKFNVGRVA